MKYLITMLMVLIIPNIAVADMYDDDDSEFTPFNDDESIAKKYWEIYGNCIIDLMPTPANDSVSSAVQRKCNKIARNPSTWQKWKYSD